MVQGLNPGKRAVTRLPERARMPALAGFLMGQIAQQGFPEHYPNDYPLDLS